jgi:hypothetical protein
MFIPLYPLDLGDVIVSSNENWQKSLLN